MERGAKILGTFFGADETTGDARMAEEDAEVWPKGPSPNLLL